MESAGLAKGLDERLREQGASRMMYEPLVTTGSSLEWESRAVAPGWLNVAPLSECSSEREQTRRLHAQASSPAYLCVTLGRLLIPRASHINWEYK